MLGAFDTFDNTVIRNSIYRQVAAEFSDRLMMGSVYFQVLSLNDSVQASAALHSNAMTAYEFFGALLVFACMRQLDGNVLIKRPA